MTRACARHAARENFAPLLYERLQHLGFLVVDEVHALDAESANLLLPEILALAAAARPAWSTTTWSARTSTFATLPSPAATGESFTARPTTAGMPFGTVATATGRPFGTRGAWSVCGSGSWSWRFWCFYRLIWHRVSFRFENRPSRKIPFGVQGNKAWFFFWRASPLDSG